MTQMMGAGLAVNIFQADDERLWSKLYLPSDILVRQPLDFLPYEYTTPWWPGGFNLAGDAGDVTWSHAIWWGDLDLTAGTQGRYGITGVTRDVYGSPLLSATVKLYLTATDALVSTTTSDANTGAYLVTTPYYPDGHYLVAYKAGSPDVEGTSVNTLIAG